MIQPVIIYIMGVSGSGKTTIGRELSTLTGIPFFDGDDYHSIANKEKMRSGKPLTDEDRQDWLLALHQLAVTEAAKKGAIIACSALKETYRQLLSEGITVPLYWVFLQGEYELISGRIKNRKDHFMPEALLQSQFEALEMPAHAIIVNITERPAKIAAEIIQRLAILS